MRVAVSRIAVHLSLGKQGIRRRREEADGFCGTVLDAGETEIAVVLRPGFFFAERPVATRAHSHTYAALDTSVIRSKILLAAHLTDFGGVEARPFHEPFMLRAFLIADRLKPSPAVADVILNGSKLFGDVFVPEIADANTIVIEINNFFIALFLQNNKHPPKKSEHKIPNLIHFLPQEIKLFTPRHGYSTSVKASLTARPKDRLRSSRGYRQRKPFKTGSGIGLMNVKYLHILGNEYNFVMNIKFN